MNVEKPRKKRKYTKRAKLIEIQNVPLPDPVMPKGGEAYVISALAGALERLAFNQAPEVKRVRGLIKKEIRSLL